MEKVRFELCTGAKQRIQEISEKNGWPANFDDLIQMVKALDYYGRCVIAAGYFSNFGDHLEFHMPSTVRVVAEVGKRDGTGDNDFFTMSIRNKKKVEKESGRYVVEVNTTSFYSGRLKGGNDQ